MKRLTFMVALLVLLVGSVPTLALADNISITRANSGWYGMNMTNTNDWALQNYFAGTTLGFVFHDYFVFDLTGISGTVQSGSLSLYLPVNGMATNQAAETYRLYIPTVSVSDVLGGYNPATFGALTAGADIGSVTVPAGSGDTLIVVTLNSAGITYLQSSLGGEVIFGGALDNVAGANPTTDNGSGTDRYLFGYTGWTEPVQLDLNVTPEVPEPATAVLLLTGGAALLRGGRRRRRPAKD